MGGGLMQLVAYGAQDIYLTGNPQITFFKVVYRRHTNFSMETISQTLNGDNTASDGKNATCTISRNGDLVYKVYVTAPSSTATNGSAMVQEVELEIGGQRIDRHYKEWNEIWNELSTPESKAVALKSMQCEIGTGSTAVEQIQIPLNFWFCRNPGLALPLIALQYHEVKLKFKWGNAGVTLSPEVWCDYIYLDTDERRRFAQVSHEYLIEQLQKETYTSAIGDKKLNFNHPVKELIWVNTTPDVAAVKYQLKLNGHDRFAEQPKEYFTLRQPFDYHTAVPRQNLPTAAQLTSNYSDITATDSLTVASVTSEADAGGTATAVGPASTELGIVKYLAYDAASGGRESTVQILEAGTTWAGDITARTNEAVAYLFLNTDMPGLVAGDLVQITGSGIRFIGGSAEGSTVIARVTDSFLSTAGGGAADLAAAIRVLQFDRVLFTGLTNIGAGDVVISSVNKVTPNSTLVTQARTSQMTEEINVYSFALKPEEHQPSGTCNFSRIDNAQLNVSGADDGGGTIYAVNYNVLRIMSGMGGLAYSN